MTDRILAEPEKRSAATLAATLGRMSAPLLVASLLLALPASYFFLDRQLAALTHPYHDAPFFVGLTYFAAPLTPVGALLAGVLGAKVLAGGALTERQDKLLRVCCAILIAGVVTNQLKDVFGRTWPETWVNDNPSYFSNATYGFFPFHGGQGWRSFPSGHASAISALAGAVWTLWPRLRWLAVAMALAVAVGLLGADYHWLSDVMAGATIGFATGAVAAKIGGEPRRIS